MKYNKGLGLFSILLIIAGVFIVGGGAYYLGTNNSSQKDDKGEMRDNYQKEAQVDDCSTWLTYNGIYTIKYPSCWKVESVEGGSIGSTGYETGIILKPLNIISNDDYISIAGWQADCSNINVSGGENPSTKAFCFKPENGEKWEGEYITSLNEGKLFGIPVVTRSINPEVLKMFDSIVVNNKK